MIQGKPRLLVEPSDYVLRNFGDMAMLRAAVERLGAVLPGAMVQVLTDEPEALQAFCPTATPLSGGSRRLWLKGGFLTASLRRRFPINFANRLQRRIPVGVAGAFERHLSDRSEFVQAVRQADLLVVAGMGGITDYFPEYARDVLRTMELALSLGRRVVMVGQGMGPLEQPGLRELAGAILPKVELIALREKRAGEPLLRELGVDPRRIVATGDDALQLAYDLRVERLGESLGINLRAAEYSAVDAEIARRFGTAIRDLAAARGATLLPLPISRVSREADIETLRHMLPDSDGELDAAEKISTPEELIRQIQRCRVVITGSYHAGVFALANGTPTIGIAKSSYYVDKFEGLADMFGRGCEVVRLDRKDHFDQLRATVDRLWCVADITRPQLLASAAEQIASNQAAYEKIAGLVTKDRKRPAVDAPIQ